jgi:CBS domain containing-hemolysin-like protein
VSGLVSNGLMILFALFLVALNGLFVAAEFAFVKIRATQVDRLVRQGKTSAGLVEEATDKLDAYLSVSQLGITISSLGLGWIGEPAFAHLLEPLLAPLGVPEGSIHVIAFAAAFATPSPRLPSCTWSSGSSPQRASPSPRRRAQPCSWRRS